MECFSELIELDRDRICLEARVLDGNFKTAEIGRSAWSFLVPMLARLDVVDVRIASPGPPKYTAKNRAGAVEPNRDVNSDPELKGPTNPSRMGHKRHHIQICCRG